MLFLSDVLQIKNKRLYIEHLCDVVVCSFLMTGFQLSYSLTKPSKVFDTATWVYKETVPQNILNIFYCRWKSGSIQLCP